MERMNRALAQDERGNALTAFLPAARVPHVPDDAPMPAALVVVWYGQHLLLVFDRFRQQWETRRSAPSAGGTQPALPPATPR
jgi:hypothetical protein